MKIRTISGAVYVAITVGFFLLRQYVNAFTFNIFLWFFCAYGTFEVARAVRAYTDKFTYVLALVFGAILVPFYTAMEYFGLPSVSSSLFMVDLSLAIYLFHCIIRRNSKVSENGESGTVNVSGLGLISLIYPSVLVLTMCFANSFNGEYGFTAMLLIFVISPLSDTFAYLVGMAYNKIKKGNAKKLCPRLSPKKTVAGAIGGIIGGIIGGATVYLVFKPQFITFIPVAMFALIGIGGAIFTEIGDLLESAIKRKVGIKDMGKIMPGHGGVMDRIDGMSLSSLFIYITFLFL